MDRKKFNEIVDEYMMYDKRTLAEMLAMIDMKKTGQGNTTTSIGDDVMFVTKRFCMGLNEYCHKSSCDGCIFSQTNEIPVVPGTTYVLNNSSSCTSVSTKNYPEFTVTTTE